MKDGEDDGVRVSMNQVPLQQVLALAPSPRLHWQTSEGAGAMQVSGDPPASIQMPSRLLWRWLRAGLMALLCLLMLAGVRPAMAGDDYLAPEVAFKFSARMLDAKTAEVRYDIADAYYMYRERFLFSASGATLGSPRFPAGKVKFDQTFQKNVETYRQSVTILVPLDAAGEFTLTATSQGCADKGLCYSPTENRITLAPASGNGLLSAARKLFGTSDVDNVAINSSPAPSTTPGMAAPPLLLQDRALPVDTPSPRPLVQPGNGANADSEMGRIESSLKGGRLLLIMPLFLLLGVGLALTPCVLPMLPILSSIIVGDRATLAAGMDKAAGRRRAFFLSLSYSLGMALVYTALGIAAGLVGEGLSAMLQKPWVLVLFALLMAAMALSMFGLWQMQMPSALQGRLTRAAGGRASGRLAGSFFMGALSALIVGPCVAAPLAGALVYISQTRDVLVGSSALFALAMGMSVPLLLLGLSAGTLLPRAGAWMDAVKSFFGVLMLGVAWWMVTPLLSAGLMMLGWAMLGMVYGAWLLWSGGRRWQGRAAGMVFVVLGVLQLIGAASGAEDPLLPLARVAGGPLHKTMFVRVHSVAELEAALEKNRDRPAMLDFYADWCVSCKEMEKHTFSDPRVSAELYRLLLLQIDVTANNADDREMLKRFGLFGPPGILFFDAQGREISHARVIGYQGIPHFLASLALVQKP